MTNSRPSPAYPLQALFSPCRAFTRNPKGAAFFFEKAMIQPITNSVPECCGIACDKHGQCARYAALEGSDGTAPRIATCDDYGTGERPLFVALERAEVVA